MPLPLANPSQRDYESFMRTMAANALGGSLGGYVCFPFESLKKQLQRGALSSEDFYNLKNGNLLHAIHPKELFRGASPFATAVMVAAATSMTFNKLFKEIVHNSPSSPKWDAAMAIGSGMLGALVGSTPVENMILVQQTHRIGPLPAAQHMLQQGIFRPWVGVRELMAREAGFAGVMLFASPTIHQAVLKQTHNKTAAVAAEVAVGALGALLTHPADTLATFRQRREGKISLWNAVKELHRKEGYTGFFKGVTARVALFVGCTLTIPRAANTIQGRLDKLRCNA